MLFLRDFLFVVLVFFIVGSLFPILVKILIESWRDLISIFKRRR